MPISYADDISDRQSANLLWKLLVRWKGSLGKLLWLEFIVYVTVYYIFNISYRLALDDSQKRVFEGVVQFCDNMKANIPVSFLLGFFVAGVIGRWWSMYLYIPWLNRMAFLVNGLVAGTSLKECQKIRFTLMRYFNLAWILLMRSVSAQMAQRFRLNKEDSGEFSLRDMFINFNKDRKVQATFRKIITDAEIRAFENIAASTFATRKSRYLPEYWVPLQWSLRVLHKAFLHGYISDPRTMSVLIKEVDVLRHQMHNLQLYCGIMIPLVYTQVVIIAVYSYFLCQLFSAQFIDPPDKKQDNKIDLYIPFFHIIEFLFIMGWLKVAMCIMHPFGDGDEDFQTSAILDHNLEVSSRVAQAETCMYPEFLEPPQFVFRKQPGHAKDTLHLYVESIDDDFEEIEQNVGHYDLTALELPPSKWTTYQNCCLCCRRQSDSEEIPLQSTAVYMNRSTVEMSESLPGTNSYYIAPMYDGNGSRSLGLGSSLSMSVEL